MTRAQVVQALQEQPSDADVLVRLGGVALDVAAVRFDGSRDAIVLELCTEDAEQLIRAFLRAGRPHPGGGNSL